MKTVLKCRRGSAPLELALAFPILAIAIAFMLWIGRAGSAKLATHADARAQVWAERPCVKAEPAFQLNRSTDLGKVERNDRRTIPGVVPVPGIPSIVESELSTHFRSWNHDDFPVSVIKPSDPVIIVHFEELQHLMAVNPEMFYSIQHLLTHLNKTRKLSPISKAD